MLLRRYISAPLLAVTLLVVMTSLVLAADVTLTIQISESPLERAQFEAVKEAFEAKHPHIRLEPEVSGGGSDWIDRTFVQLVAGTAPDIMRTWGPFHVVWAQNGLLLDLAPYVARDLTSDEIADFFPPTWLSGELHFGERAGMRFGMPRYVNVGTLWFNKDHFDNSGLLYPTTLYNGGDWNWQTFTESARKLLLHNGDEVTRWGADEVFSNMRWATYVWAAGGDITNWPNRPLQLTLNSPEVVQGLEFAQRLRAEHQVMPAEPGNASGFVHQKTSMLLSDANGILGTHRNAIQGSFNWDIAPLPIGPSGKGPSWTASDLWSVSASTAHPEEAWTVVKFLSSREGMALWTGASGQGPARHSLLEHYSSVVPDFISAWVFFEAAGNANLMATQYLPNANEIQAVLRDAVLAIYRSEKSVQQALSEVTPVVETLIADLIAQ